MWKRFISHYLLINLFTFNLCSNIFSSKFAAKIKRRDKIHKIHFALVMNILRQI
uniref:Uncharacterized protein n=1 Tax=Meloidogyne enterolobii TaxID=390850 RepID=A0A6V7VAH2_MELEN|nr:unnamed protein product [Meloidogyne enterolobii]